MNVGFEIINKSKGIKSNIFTYIFNILIRIVISMLISISVVNIIYSTLNITYDYNTIIYYSVITCLICLIMYIRFPILWFAIGVGLVADYVFDNIENLKTGVLAICNEGYEVIRNCLGLPYADGFKVIEGVDCSNEVNLVIAISTVAAAIAISFFIGRYLSVVAMTALMVGVISYVSVLENVASELSVVVLAGCFFAVVMIKNSFFKKSLLQGVMLFAALFVAVVSIGNFAFDKNSFDKYIKPMEEKSYLEYALRDVMVLKYAEFKDFEIQKNVNTGQLGYFSCVKPVFKDIFTIKTTPVNDKLYLRSFVGSEYKYRSNCWNSVTDINDVNISDRTAKALENANADYNDVEFMKFVENFLYEIYVPYYTVISDCDGFVYENDCSINGSDVESYKVRAYDVADVNIDDNDIYDDIVKNYTYIDAENLDAVNEVLKNAGIDKNCNLKEVEDKLRTYFAQNYVYDFDSSVVPFGKDFVNYFLQETKKGDFAHFASSAVLAYRALGIPARYAGGYVVGNEQILAGKADKRGSFTFKLNMANMYAWVEVYEKGFGWKAVDISPSPNFAELKEKYDNEDIKVSAENDNVLETYFKPIENEYYNPLNLDKNVLKLAVAVVAFGVLCVIMWLFGRKACNAIMWNVRYNRAENDVKAFMIMDKLRVKYGLAESCDYSDICNVIRNKNNDVADRILWLSEKIVFGKNAKNEEVAELRELIKKV